MKRRRIRTKVSYDGEVDMSQNHDGSGRGSSNTPPGTPRWVKFLGVIAIALVLLMGIVMLTGGEHGPGRHLPPAAVTEAGTMGGHTAAGQHGG